MPIINIKNAPHGWQTDQRYVYIGRPGGGLAGPFGNPFRIGPDGDRLEVLARYDLWLRGRLITDAAMKKRIAGLHGKTLVCFCSPFLCHGDLLQQVAAELNRNEQL
jgi:hypothetical protein